MDRDEHKNRDDARVLDARGTMCPEPIRRARACLDEMAPGEELCVLATDPAAPIDFEAWCLRGSHEFLACRERDGGWEIRLRKGRPQN